jgi:hypothetical protein
MKRGACRNSTRKSPLRIGAEAYRFPNCHTTPPPTLKLCCLLLPVFTPRFGVPDQKSRTSPRNLSERQSLTSRPIPNWNTPVVDPPLGFFPPNSSCELGLNRPTPPPMLTQGDTPVVAKAFARSDGSRSTRDSFRESRSHQTAGPDPNPPPAPRRSDGRTYCPSKNARSSPRTSVRFRSAGCCLARLTPFTP